MTTTVLRISLALVAWAAAMAGSLSITNLPGNWGHSICGAWGCGPPLQALLACHLSWAVLLAPPAWFVMNSPSIPARYGRHLGRIISVLAISMLLAVVVHERAVWWPAVGEWQQVFFWQRCGFVIATSVDLPMVQLLSAGLYLCRARRFTSPAAAVSSSDDAGENPLGQLPERGDADPESC